MNRQNLQLSPPTAIPKAAAPAPTTGDTAPTTGDTAPTAGDTAPTAGDTVPGSGDSTPVLSLDECTLKIHTLAVSGGAVQYAIGVVYNYILDNRLTEKAGYQRASVYFAHEFQEFAQSTLSLYGAVASTFTEDESRKHTVTKLGKLITYFNTMKQSLPEDDPGAILIKVPEKKGAVVEKRFADCTRSDMSKAIKLLAGVPPQMPATDSQSVELFHDALRAGVGHESNAALKAVYTEQDGTLVNLTNVKLSEFQAVAARLAAVPPAPQSPALGRPCRMRSLQTLRH